jgi:flagellar motor switch protein FliN
MSDEDDLLDPNEIEALLSGGGGPAPPAGKESPPEKEEPSSATEPAQEEASDLLNENELEALMSGGSGASPKPDALLDQAQAGLSAAVAHEVGGIGSIPGELGSPAEYSFESFDNASSDDKPSVGLDALKEVDLDLRVELGKAELLIDEVLKLVKGSVVPLDKLAGDPVDVIVNDNLVARGEVLVLNGNFCVRIAEILSPES